jgi:hypothetical protein
VATEYVGVENLGGDPLLPGVDDRPLLRRDRKDLLDLGDVL